MSRIPKWIFLIRNLQSTFIIVFHNSNAQTPSKSPSQSSNLQFERNIGDKTNGQNQKLVFKIQFIIKTMKEEKKAKDKLDKIKERRQKKSTDKKNNFDQEAFQQIDGYKIFIDKLIGEGSFGRVYKAKSDETGQMMACKVISKNKLESIKLYQVQYAEELQKRFKTESQFHKKLSGYPYIVNLVDTVETSKAYYFVMEYCETDLSKIIKEQGIIGEEQALKYFTQMVEGYKSIFQNNAFHRDLKPQNLLIKEDSIKISDFGFVKIFSDIDMEISCRSGKNKLRTESKVGSIKYMAPDVLGLVSSESNISPTYNAEKSDIWSMGIILYKMLYGKEPYSGKDEEQMMKIISQKQLTFPDTAKISPEDIRNTNVSPEVKKLIKKMIDKNEDSRISFKKLYSKLNELNKDRQSDNKEKKTKKTKETTQEVNGVGQARSKKQQLLIFYNSVIVKLYHDSTNYASLREIGIENYYEITCKLMTLIHFKRSSYLQNEEKEGEVSDKIKQDISSYHNFFAERIQNIGKVDKQDTIKNVLLDIYPKIKQYDEYELFTNEVLIFLIDLMLLLSLQLKVYEPNFVYIESNHLEKKKKDVILKYWQSTIKNIEKKMKGQLYEVEELIKKERKHKQRQKQKQQEKKKKKQLDQNIKDDQLQQQKVQKDRHKEKKHKKDKDRSKDRHKSRDRKEKS